MYDRCWGCNAVNVKRARKERLEAKRRRGEEEQSVSDQGPYGSTRYQGFTRHYGWWKSLQAAHMMPSGR